ncbi:MAG: hypothetical protein JSU96_05215, partial [Acidobacteriota bacterium]
PIDILWWRRAEMAQQLAPGVAVDLAYSLSRDSFQGMDRLVMTVQDLCRSEDHEPAEVMSGR